LPLIRGYVARTTAIDKHAAERFIKHAIAEAQSTKGPGMSIADDSQPIASSSSEARLPIKVTSKMIAREEYEKNLRDLQEDSEDDALEVVNSTDPPEPSSSNAALPQQIGQKRPRKKSEKASTKLG
jgi:exosome complex protein LRP1